MNEINEFLGKNRNVKLIGAAFFEITKNPNQTFKIDTEYSIVKVLGTSFNVKALPNDSNTSIIEKTGKVEFLAKNNFVSYSYKRRKLLIILQFKE